MDERDERKNPAEQDPPSDSENRAESDSAAHGADALPTPNEKGTAEDDSLEWLDALSAGYATEEMATMQWPHDQRPMRDDARPARPPVPADDEDAAPIEDVEDAMAWLENLALGQGTPIEEMPTMLADQEGETAADAAAKAGDEAAPAAEEEPAERAAAAADSLPFGEAADDPMAWLEHLATNQDTPLEELPSVADRLLASEIISQVEGSRSAEVVYVPLQEALDFLTARARAQNINLDEVKVGYVSGVAYLEDSLRAVDRLAVHDAPLRPARPATAPVGEEPPSPVDWADLSAQMPEDPDEALAWLETLADEATLSDAELVAPAEAAPAEETAEPTGETAESGAPTVTPDEVAAALGPDFLAQMPEDPDEAMVWLEKVAAEQNAALQQDDEILAASAETAAVPDLEQMDTQASMRVPREAESAAEATGENVRLLAREAVQAGNVDAALGYYRQAVTEIDDVDALIADLETAVAQYPDRPKLWRLLGDAYMHGGQKDKAAEAYRQALDQL